MECVWIALSGERQIDAQRAWVRFVIRIVLVPEACSMHHTHALGIGRVGAAHVPPPVVRHRRTTDSPAKPARALSCMPAKSVKIWRDCNIRNVHRCASSKIAMQFWLVCYCSTPCTVGVRRAMPDGALCHMASTAKNGVARERPNYSYASPAPSASIKLSHGGAANAAEHKEKKEGEDDGAAWGDVGEEGDG